MKIHRSHLSIFVYSIILLAIFLASGSVSAFEKGQEPGVEMCLGCHGMEDFSMPDPDDVRQLHVSKDSFLKSVHAKRTCLECHKDIEEIPHRTNINRIVGCVECHQNV